MQIRRTANAGVLLTLDDVSILLDGVCGAVAPYLATPDALREALTACPLNALAFTHDHEDHFDREFGCAFQKKNLRPVFGPESLPLEAVVSKPGMVGSVRITPVPSKHIGAVGKTCDHVSFVLEGSRCVWFLGDATPLQWKNRNDLLRPDVLIAPYAYASSPMSWEITKQLGAKQLILVHLPPRSNDPAALWPAVEQTVGTDRSIQIFVPEMGQTIRFQR